MMMILIGLGSEVEDASIVQVSNATYQDISTGIRYFLYQDKIDMGVSMASRAVSGRDKWMASGLGAR